MSDRERQARVERLLEDLWPARQPPKGFAERVLGAGAAVGPVKRQRPPGETLRGSGSRRWAWLAAAGAALAAAVVVLVFGLRSVGEWSAGEGHFKAQIRETLQIGRRAVAVLEAGAEIAWSRQGHGDGGAVRVDQPRGSVFYRVDRGGAFQVVTPAGEIEVRGTCFRVVAGSGDGPTPGPLATTAAVEVLEGLVVLRARRGELRLAAGERGLLTLGMPPHRDEAPPASSSQTAAPAGSHLWRSGAALRGFPVEVGAGSDRRRRDDKYFGFTAEERRDLARRCKFRWGLPRHLTHFATSDFTDLPLSADQRAGLTRVLERHREEFLHQLRAIYLEVVGDERTAETLSMLSLFQEVDAKSPRADGIEARRLILREWEGSATPPTDVASRPALERFWRLLVGAQDDLVRRLESVVGPADARQIAQQLLDIRMDGLEPQCPSGAERAGARD